MEKEASVLERDHVHSVYEKIAPYFSDARYRAWPKVQEFLLAQEPGSLIADIGCGNGKYLHINTRAFKVGCDYCFPLAESARNQGYEVMVCDGLSLPYRNECFDTVLSIAVIHHFSTKERRIRAIKEMARILRTGGQIMIYVWALEQKRRKFGKQDIFVPWNTEPSSRSHAPHAGNKPKSQDHRKKSVNHCSGSIDGATKTSVEEKETFYTSFEKSLRWKLFSKSLDSVLDLGECSSNKDNLPPTNEQSLFKECSVSLNRKKLFEQKETGTSKKGDSQIMFTQPRNNSKDDASRVDVSLLPHCCSDILRIGSGSTSRHPPSEDLMHDCSRVSLPDLVSHRKGLRLKKQIKIHSPPKQIDSCKHLSKSKASISLLDMDQDIEMHACKNLEQMSSNGACLRYYHVFRKGELVELIEHHIPELRVVQAFFDHANWCVVAEKVQVWKI
ncbi:probable tRNA methyltransferase 9B [Ambystoma mexicanum]|uniref:probable tRNA methyltransferase 9B n=1 Tax=Ambystoma mexicanum TaxID=8296 RepID=UPI0037E8C991